MSESRPTRRGWIAVGLAVTVALSSTVVAPAWSQAPPPGPVDDPMAAARQAAQRHAFSGKVLVRWRDANGVHEQLVDVRAINGSLMVQGNWAPRMRSVGPARPTGKYELTSVDGPIVAGRPSRVIEVRRGGYLVERVWLDAITGLLLGREQYAVAGAPARSMQFQQISLDTGGGVAPTPRRARSSPMTPPRENPSALPGGYHRVGCYKRGSVVQSVYSDGVYGLSVFQQPGRLDTDALPQGARPISIGQSRGWHYAWAGGHIAVWEGRDRVLSAVGDGPVEDLVRAGAAIPLGSPPSSLERLRRAVGSLLRGLTGG